MPKANYANAFAMFTGATTKTASIKALNGAKIEYRTLTMQEADGFASRLVKGYGDDGTPQIDYEEASKIKYEKVSLIMVNPKMSIEELQALPASAAEAIAEINTLVEEKDESFDEEGNSEDSADKNEQSTK